MLLSWKLEIEEHNIVLIRLIQLIVCLYFILYIIWILCRVFITFTVRSHICSDTLISHLGSIKNILLYLNEPLFSHCLI